MVLAPDEPRRLVSMPSEAPNGVLSRMAGGWPIRPATPSAVSSVPNVTKGRWQISPGGGPSLSGRAMGANCSFWAHGQADARGRADQPDVHDVGASLVLERSYVWNAVGLPAQYDVSLEAGDSS